MATAPTQAPARRPASRSVPVPASIVPVFGVTCSTPECGFHESLHTTDPTEAVRTARELGWRIGKTDAACPLCCAAAGKGGAA